LPRRWSTSADIPTSGPPRDQKAPPSDQGEQGRVRSSRLALSCPSARWF
jgi:hypothetical protein